MKLDPFYLIVDSAAWVQRLVPVGVKLVQLRIKDLDEASLRREVRTSKAVCDRHGCQLIVNDYWRLAIEENCDFVHLGQEDLAEADVKAIRRAGLKLGLSTHDDAELETALEAEPDYVALGPIYPTILKAMKWAPQGLDSIAIWKQRVGNIPVVAIGGLTVERIAGVFAQGADSAAVVTDITRNVHPEARMLEWLAATAPWR
ncbi:thiamine phosphate synthase [Mesorhizobium sp. M2D.F.Ca.ET.185.01.1.1]|uniref:thiamine phosphate synthase n=1 Tax=unclassified Mesorhizobium TaxID=325217 RepID=UPI000FCC81CD|nr:MULTISPECIES: thiamine phosphate synthase [unclassified Mesorhizobium]TGP77353.1 thiamine phosphate synthase [bacterium M00.F.Ca.ET.227.01.1.1]TGP93147.1 thiamine phosphate synthase [bacterium M00.F.Ca.ET.222.01.1.1]TGP96693.1 thiamine phosphate synthase [bacterium M00.F.Ca.ET.221.01.1.1]TGT95033.1 thiamine phosphate synthase [bacterium M00.F.Ca.ET.163.01.1.1]TGU18462.1 thiamine phosphate synthase [bacterium M00.F.Ca.ET.156.01.1.1]TGU49905.1 thiamine phosphate synthase [bacterium M00.F.Ca.